VRPVVTESDSRVRREETTELAGRAARAVPGSNAEIARLLERVMPRVFKFFCRRVYDVAMAEDLASQTLAGVLQALLKGSYDPGRSFNTFLWTIARRRLADEYDARKKKPPPEAGRESDSGLRAVDTRLDGEAILRAIHSRLGSEKYEAFLLHYEGFRATEIAEIVRRDRKTIASWLAEAQDIARRMLV
jgi:RNA polymerase sigma factor (sigma-70 family)